MIEIVFNIKKLLGKYKRKLYYIILVKMIIIKKIEKSKDWNLCVG